MPRTTCRSSEPQQQQNIINKGNNNNNNNDDEDKSTNNNNNNNTTNNDTASSNIKKEFVAPLHAAPAAEVQVVHRKSERRRVARDIFLVFEEQPSGRRRGAKGKATRAKQKFGHLKVQNPRPTKCNILREIKTEPKCAQTAAEMETVAPDPAPPPLVVATPKVATSPIATLELPAPPVAEPAPVIVKECRKTSKATIKLETKTALNAKAAIKAAANHITKAPQATTSTSTTITTKATIAPKKKTKTASSTTSSVTTPSVNPIFLWVKQDDTRIVEVRCEDYDKRNRIRLTKTTNGHWRSTPRTDASSTRIVKFFQTAAATSASPPLMKVKREVYENHQQHLLLQQQELQQQQEAQLELDTAMPPMTTEAETAEICAGVAQKLLQDWNEDTTTLENTLSYAPPEIVGNVMVVPPTPLVIAPTDEMCSQLMERQLTMSSPLPIPSPSAAVRSEEDNDMNMQSTVCFETLMQREAVVASNDTVVDNKNLSETTTTYQSSPTPMELQLCPMTGLFLPKGVTESVRDLGVRVSSSQESLQDKILLDDTMVLPTNADKNTTSVDDVVTSDNDNAGESLFDVNTKNLKDLLDDADLLQHCSSDNGSNGADLLDSLVKRSCEDNLVQDTSSSTTTAATVTVAEAMMKDALNSFGIISAELNDLNTKDLPPIMDMVDDAPKCLSFNEAGEIEGLNGELFQSNNFIDTFEKETQLVVVEPAIISPIASVDAIESQSLPLNSNEKSPAAVTDETPKDLSYKKREEVCPPSESRSQCAVTSSSDILKSPSHEENTAIPVEVEATSETIKNLILEQFIKLNALNQLPGMPTVANLQHQQAEPMDLGKCREKTVATTTTSAVPARRGATANSYMETVVLDEEEDDIGPLKKRHCSAVKATMNKDPDALTQLKMLLSNPQWKVPDPILVPKDRLGAVLASPAREIPLLLTTRPELRLPEAFAYPEIIQNPNILVISMAQLEAILKNDMEQTQNKETPPLTPNVNLNEFACKMQASAKEPLRPQQQQQPATVPQRKPSPLPAPPPVKNNLVPNKCAHTAHPQPADSSLATDINAATLAVLQQMIWLPYIGQLSQEFFKTLKDPMGIQRKFGNNMMPAYYNNQFGLQHLDEMYKHYVKQMSTPKHTQHKEPTPSPPVPPPPAKVHPTSRPPPTPPAVASQPNFNAFPNQAELAFFQKLFQPQMPNFLSMNAAAAAAAAAAASTQQQPQCEPTPQQQQQQLLAAAALAATQAAKNATANAELHAEQKRARRSVPAEATSGFEALNIPDFNSNFCTNAQAGNNNAVHVEKKQTAASAPPPTTEQKPRLTCKSLSNLLDPENIKTTTGASSVPLLTVPFDGLRRGAAQNTKLKNPAAEAASNSGNTRTLRSSKVAVTYNSLEHAKQQIQPTLQPQLPPQQQLQRKRSHNMHIGGELQADAAANANNMNAANNMDANGALWHPLFGSNPKTGYNSPWQWTTVTAAGE